jgi:hypothetical protein
MQGCFVKVSEVWLAATAWEGRGRASDLIRASGAEG